jgi:hypothetical protein
MKKKIIYLFAAAWCLSACSQKEPLKPRVFVFTDINIDSGDPDDRQSLVHLLWYANELELVGVVPDRWEARGLEACQLAAAAYEKDFREFKFVEKGFPAPAAINQLFASDREDAFARFAQAAADTSSPLYVLVWGDMVNFSQALARVPSAANNIRLITIGTDRMVEAHIPYLPEDWEKADLPCQQYNWNGYGRDVVFQDPRFSGMWWLEINWTYEGMFSGNEPAQMLDSLAVYGNLGQHLRESVANEEWAQYFRVGDTPSVLYLIDPENQLDDPSKGSWAGRFVKPFPEKRPNYYTDDAGSVIWDYAQPCNTWENHVAVNQYAASTLGARRPAMYKALLEKLDKLYK